jgi:hypothetical protein
MSYSRKLYIAADGCPMADHVDVDGNVVQRTAYSPERLAEEGLTLDDFRPAKAAAIKSEPKTSAAKTSPARKRTKSTKP